MSGMKDIVEQITRRMDQDTIINDAKKVSRDIVKHKKRIRAGIEGYDNLIKYEYSMKEKDKELYRVQQKASFEALGFGIRGGYKPEEINPNLVGEALVSNLYAAFSHVYFVIEGLAYAIEKRNLNVQSSPYNPGVFEGEDVWPLRDILNDLNEKSLELIISKSDLESKGNKIDFTPVEDLSYREIPHWKNYKGKTDQEKAFSAYFSDISKDMRRIKEETALGRDIFSKPKHYRGINQVCEILIKH